MTARHLDIRRYQDAVRECSSYRIEGRVSEIVGLSVQVVGLRLAVGDVCAIYPVNATNWISAEVVGFQEDHLLLMPFSDLDGIRSGCRVVPRDRGFVVPVGHALLGRVLDGLARPMDGAGPLAATGRRVINSAAPDPLARPEIRTPLGTGVRAIDGVLTCGKGQRIGIFAGSGVGKSTLLEMLARNARSDVNVIALIGERGREVQEFIQHNLGPEGLARSVVVVATSDQPALQRIKAAWVATTIAEYFRDAGKDVTLLMDSITRWAMAAREVGLSAGEPPVLKGYPPSVFARLPKLLEKAGTSPTGTITGFYTVLVEGDDLNEPMADAARSILDGHIWLSRKLAHKNHYPAIDVLGSVSRLMPSLVSPSHQSAANELRHALATYHAFEDLVSVGAYVPGTNPALDRALAVVPKIEAFLRQTPSETVSYARAVDELVELFPSEVTSGN